MIIEHENTFQQALENGINLFVGAGFSVLAKDAKGEFIPTGPSLKNELLKIFDIDELSTLGLPQICTILEAERKDDFYNFLKLRFSVDTYDERYNSLDKLALKTIFTTNIDDLLYKVFALSSDHYINDITLRGPSFDKKTAIDLIPLHGSIVHEGEQLVFSTLDLAVAFSTDPDKWHFLTQRIQMHPTIFWGYSLEDAGVLQAISPITSRGRVHATKWIVLRSQDEATSKYFRSLGFETIIGDTSEFLDYINAYAFKRYSDTQSSGISEKFPQWSLPAVGTVPARPILEFYLGSPPTWYDVFSGHLYRTSHFSTIVDKINGHKSLVVVGLPACGKTTLMMQVASSIEYKGHKLICGSLTPEMANNIINRLNGERAIIFIDEFTGDADA
jgi:hypothetical protein